MSHKSVTEFKREVFLRSLHDLTGGDFYESLWLAWKDGATEWWFRKYQVKAAWLMSRANDVIALLDQTGDHDLGRDRLLGNLVPEFRVEFDYPFPNFIPGEPSPDEPGKFALTFESAEQFGKRIRPQFKRALKAYGLIINGILGDRDLWCVARQAAQRYICMDSPTIVKGLRAAERRRGDMEAAIQKRTKRFADEIGITFPRPRPRWHADRPSGV